MPARLASRAVWVAPGLLSRMNARHTSAPATTIAASRPIPASRPVDQSAGWRSADEVTAGVVGAPAAAPPRLTYRGGPLLSAVKVFTVFWGSTWSQAPQSGLLGEINGFFDYILTSALIDQLAEYSVARYQIIRKRQCDQISGDRHHLLEEHRPERNVGCDPGHLEDGQAEPTGSKDHLAG